MTYQTHPEKQSIDTHAPKAVPLVKQILLYTISVIFFLIGLFGFMQIGWLVSKPLTDEAKADLAQKTEVPDYALAYNINHGNYIFFNETPRDTPKKTTIILLMLIGGLGVSTSINIYLSLKKRKRQNI